MPAFICSLYIINSYLSCNKILQFTFRTPYLAVIWPYFLMGLMQAQDIPLFWKQDLTEVRARIYSLHFLYSI